MNGGKLQGRVALITGASRNIGRAVALAFAAEGADLVLNTRVNADELEAVAAECRKAGARVVTALGDVGDATACQAMVERGLAELGAIDVLVCNAAIRPHKSVTDTSVEEWHRVLGVNLHSAWRRSVSMNPGITMFTRIPNGPSSAASARTRPSKPVLATVTTAVFGRPVRLDIPPRATMLPRRRSFIAGTAARAR